MKKKKITKITKITKISQLKGIGKKVIRVPKISPAIRRALRKRIIMRVPRYGEKQNILTYPESLGYRVYSGGEIKK